MRLVDACVWECDLHIHHTCSLVCEIKAPPSKPKSGSYTDKLKYDQQMAQYRKEHAKWLRDTQTQSEVGYQHWSHGHHVTVT